MYKSSRLIYAGIILLFLILTAGISTADEVNVEYVSQFGEDFSHIVVDGNYAYLTQDKDFVVVDITDVSKPSEVGRVSLPSKIADIDVSDKYACVVDEYDFYLVDVINADSPSILGNCDIGVSSNPKAVAISDNYACVVVEEYGLVILDINNPSSPKITSRFDDTVGYSFFHGVDVDVSGKYAYLVGDDSWPFLCILDITNLYSPTLVDSYSIYSDLGVGITILDNFAYIGLGLPGLAIWDITDPTSAKWVGGYGRFEPSNYTTVVAVEGNYAYIPKDDRLEIVDISSPASSKLAGTYDGVSASDVAVSGNYAYLAAGSNGLVILHVETAQDTTPPAPVTNLKETGVGPSWIRWTWVNPTDVDFKHVMVYIDGLFVTNTSEGFYNATGLAEGTTHNISTKTVDTSGNTNSTWVNDSATTTVTVDTTPPASVANLRETGAGPTWINWIWTNPNDADFKHVVIYLNGTFVTNTSGNFINSYNATGLAEGATYTIGLHTVDTSGNINPTWVNDSATTTIPGDAAPPASVTNLKEAEAGQNWIRWTWVNPADTDFSHVIVYLDGVFVTNTSNGFYTATELGSLYISDLDVEDEWLKVKNSGSSTVNLTGWQIKDEGNLHTYTFPSFQLQSGVTVTLYTAKGNNTETELYWGSDGFIWNNEGDTAYIYNSGGYPVDSLRSGTTHTIKETTHIISTKTVDTSGNINPTWVNDSATTTNQTDTTPPTSVTNLKEAGAGQNWIRWTWVNPTDTDFSHVIVYLDGSFVTNTSNASYTATELGNLYISDLDVEDEWLKVKNSGSSTVNLTGWQIKDEGNLHTYTFPSFQLKAGATVTLYTAKGNNTETELYWGSDGSVWNNEEDTAFLYNSGGYPVNSLRSGTTHTIKETTHIISTKTVDSSGNLNPLWVNDSATTSSPSSGGGGGGGSSTSKTSSGGGGGGAGSVEDFANVALKDADSEYLRMNANVTYEFTREGNPIQSFSFYSLKNSGQITSTIEVLNNRSKLVNSSPEGMVYKYINIWVGNAGFATAANIKDARVKFKVSNPWIQNMGVSPRDVKLQRYNGTAWEVLPTTLESNTTGYAIFESRTPGFSPFSITAERGVVPSVTGEAETTPIQTEEVGVEEIQPEKSRLWTFILAIFIVGVFVVGYEYLKRQQK